MIDVSRKVAATSDYQLTRADIQVPRIPQSLPATHRPGSTLQEWEAENGALGPECIALMFTGRSAHWADTAAYFGTDNPAHSKTFHWPGFTSCSVVSLFVYRGRVWHLSIPSVICRRG